MRLKYIVISDGKAEYMVVFPHNFAHKYMTEAVKAIKEGLPSQWRRPYIGFETVAAGFITSDGICEGESESLGLKSRGAIDTQLFDDGCERWLK